MFKHSLRHTFQACDGCGDPGNRKKAHADHGYDHTQEEKVQ